MEKCIQNLKFKQFFIINFLMNYNIENGANQDSELHNIMDECSENNFQISWDILPNRSPNQFQDARMLLQSKVEEMPFWFGTQVQFPSLSPCPSFSDSQNQEIEEEKIQSYQEKKSEEPDVKKINNSQEKAQEVSQEQKKNLLLLTPKTEAENLAENIQDIPSLDLQTPHISEEKKITKCNCKKSKCLKLYCECFRSGEVCGKDCVCLNCQNTTQNSAKRKKVIQEIIEKDDNAFLEPVKYNGCRCTKNHCSKNYCECYRLGVGCGKYCQCLDCENSGGRKQRRRKTKGRVKARF